MRFDHLDYWKAITLYGLNVATYKPALATCILKEAKRGTSILNWEDLSSSFLSEYILRLKNNNMPQQTNPGRQTKLERIVRQLDLGKIDFGQAVNMVSKDGFTDVVPRFHNIGNDRQFASDYFYETDFGKNLILKSSLQDIAEKDSETLLEEVTARWSLLEGAFSINHSNFDLQLANDIRDVYLQKGYERTPLTQNLPFLSGYQGNTCFYCAEELEDIAVDHVLPRQVVHHDEIWNLVLAHGHCNQLKSDLLVGPHFIEKLITRNENIMGSNHPWKSKIQEQLGTTPAARARKIRVEFEKVKAARGSTYWGGVSNYNPEIDPFFRRLITQLSKR